MFDVYTTTSFSPVGRFTVYQRSGIWWLAQWHELNPNQKAGLQITSFDSEDEAENAAQGTCRFREIRPAQKPGGVK